MIWVAFGAAVFFVALIVAGLRERRAYEQARAERDAFEATIDARLTGRRLSR